MSLYVNDVWLQTLEQVVTHGRLTKPRGIPCYELNKTTVTLMNYPCVTIKDRKLNYKFMAAEAHWILSGSNQTKDIVPFNKNIAKYSDDGITYFGAYGPKFIEQVGYVVDCLTKDPESRQAVINIWREKPRATKDVPCTLNVQFMIRDNKLECHVNMRSSDLWLGWPYDVFNFSCMAEYIMHYLRDVNYACPADDLGALYLHANSMHLYESDLEKAKALLAGDRLRRIEPTLNTQSRRHLMSELEVWSNNGNLKGF